MHSVVSEFLKILGVLDAELGHFGLEFRNYAGRSDSVRFGQFSYRESNRNQTSYLDKLHNWNEG